MLSATSAIGVKEIANVLRKTSVVSANELVQKTALMLIE
jgi:hypothetical protein